MPPAPRRSIYWSRGEPDLRHDFLVIRSAPLDRAGFLAQVARDNTSAPDPELPLFVHGFNTSFPEALLRLAKLTAESGSSHAPVLFSWPSRGKALAYISDREAALFSRDALAKVLDDLTALPGPTLLAAHSLGAWLSMEALRSLAESGRRRTIDDLDILLMAPDIDLLVFRQELLALGRLPGPIAVMSAPDDRALAISARVSTGRPRLGALEVDDPTIAKAAHAAQVQLIDISAVQPETRFRHSRFMRLAQMYRAMEDDPGALDMFRAAGAFVLNSLGTGLLQVGATIAGI